MTGAIDPCRHPCTTLVLALVLGNVQQVTVAAIQKRLHPFFASRRIPLPSFASRSKAEGEASMRPALRLLQLTPHFLQADFAHHRPTSFTPLVLEADLRVLQACMLHTTHLQAFILHTTRPASRLCFTPLILKAAFASHHSCCVLHTTSCKPTLLHITHPACFTPRVLQAFRLHTTHPASSTPLVPEAGLAAHHSSCKRTCFTPLILRASHHTSCKPSCFTPHVR